jgi:hydroxyacylglutathione hydrolase
VELPHFPGWHLLGAFPDGVPDDVGSWLLAHDGEAMLLEVPPGLTVRAVRSALKRVGAGLRYVAASHSHEDHLDPDTWARLTAAFPAAEAIPPAGVSGDHLLHIGGEPVWLVKAPKHSADDVVTVFRGVAMTGDIELGMLASVNREVRRPTKMKSMDRLRDFQDRTGYHVHSIVSAHLNDVRVSVHWPDLFRYDDALRQNCRRCGGRLRPIEPDSAGFDRTCEACGRTEWSDPRKK